jgi:hypothetical protein
MKEVLSMKVAILYEVIREVKVDLPDEVIDELDFQAMWNKIHELDPETNCDGEILQVVDVNTKEEYYC